MNPKRCPFQYRSGALFCGGVSASALAEQYGTPLYVYVEERIVEQARAYQTAFAGYDPLICYAMKANPNPEILRLLAKEGCGADIVSSGELSFARKSGIEGKKIVFAGVGKTDQEIRAGLEEGIYSFNVESMEEAKAVAKVAEEMDKIASISVRVNPDVDAKTHDYITTGKKENKFGVDLESAKEIYRWIQGQKSLEAVGVHMHIGSQLLSVEPFREASVKLEKFISALRQEGIQLKNVDLGGGLGICYHDERPPETEELFDAFKEVLDRTGLRPVLEPGRSMVGEAGALLTRALYRKQGGSKKFVIIDAGMNDLLRPALYQAYHEALTVKENSGPLAPRDLVGPICESGDFLAKDRELPEIQKGDLIAFTGSGAYGFSMASNYNLRGRPAEVLVTGEGHRLIRKRESSEDLWKGYEV